jgi:hypothetical protein
MGTLSRRSSGCFSLSSDVASISRVQLLSTAASYSSSVAVRELRRGNQQKKQSEPAYVYVPAKEHRGRIDRWLEKQSHVATIGCRSMGKLSWEEDLPVCCTANRKTGSFKDGSMCRRPKREDQCRGSMGARPGSHVELVDVLGLLGVHGALIELPHLLHGLLDAGLQAPHPVHRPAARHSKGHRSARWLTHLLEA